MSSLQDLKRQLLEDPNLPNNVNAANQLANVAERDEAIKILRKGFEITSPDLHIALMNALVKHGAKEAIPEISSCLKSPNPAERNKAIEVLISPQIKDPSVVHIFRERLHFERDVSAKVLLIQKLAELPYEESVDILLELLQDERYKASPFIENIRNSLTTVGTTSPQKMIKKLDSSIGDEIVTILTGVNLSTNPEVWKALLTPMDDESEEVYSRVKKIIVGQLTRDYSEDRAGLLIANVVGHEASGRTKQRSIEIIDEISKSPLGPKLVKPTLQILKVESEEKLKRAKFVQELELEIKHFVIARQIFEEVKDSYISGNYRASIILGISALESCIKADYILNVSSQEEKKPEEAQNYVRKTYLSDLLDRYFDRKDINRLPTEYKPFVDIYRKIRNSLVHPEEFTFTEPMVRQTLTSISELIKSLEGKQSGRN